MRPSFFRVKPVVSPVCSGAALGKSDTFMQTPQNAMLSRVSLLGFLSLTLAALMPSTAKAQAVDHPSSTEARQAVVNRLMKIRLESVTYDGLPLSEVVARLREVSKTLDPDKKGVNFMINPAAPEEDKQAGTSEAQPRESVDIDSVLIRIKPPLADLRLIDVVDAVVKVADKPIQYSVEDYGVVFSVRESPAARPEEPDFVFPGGTPSDFLSAVEKQYKADWKSVADIPRELADVRIPRLRIPARSVDLNPRRKSGEGDAIAALVGLYNQLGEQKPDLGRLIVRGNLNKPSVVMFVPDKSVDDEQSRFKVKAFSIYGCNEAEKGKLEEDIERAKMDAVAYAEHVRGPTALHRLQGTISIHSDTSLLVATGSNSYVEMVESIVTAWRTTKDRPTLQSLTIPGPTAK